MDTAYQVELRELAPQCVAVVRGQVDLAGIPDFVSAAFGETLDALAKQHLAPSGPPFARYHVTADGFDIEAGFPATATVTAGGRVEGATLPGGPVATVLHRGDYSAVSAAYDAAMAWIGSHDYHPSADPWECYLDRPDVAEPRTLVHVPCQRN